MFNTCRTWLFGLTLGFIAATSGAATDPATAEMLMRKSGLWEQLSSLAPQVRSGFLDTLSQAGIKPPEDELARLSRVIEQAYAPERLRAASLAVLMKGVEARHVPALQAWFDTRVGQTITKLEEAASADDRDPEALMREGAAKLAEQTPARRAMLEELLQITQTAEMMTRMNIGSTLAAQRGAASMAPPGAKVPTEAELRAALEAQRPQLLQVFGAFALASSAKTYDALPTAELEQYLVFLKSEAGKHFSDVSVLAFEEAMNIASTDFGRGITAARGTRS